MKRTAITLLLLASLCACTLPMVTACAAKTAADGPFEDIRAWLRKQVVEQQVASVAVAVARDGKILWEEGFGWADRENRLPATEHTMYSLASISKPITATGLMVLKERGKLDLDRPINDYLGEAKLRARVGDGREATVRRVANHTSGLPLHYQFFYEDEPYRAPSRDETILRYGNLVSAPGETYEYSNLGYGVLDYVIARVSGKPYAEFMRTEVFLPLGLTRMAVNIPAGEKNHAVRYAPDGTALPFYDFDHPGGSAVYASAHDLVRFGMFHLKAHLPDQKAILSDAAIDDMQKPTVTTGRDSGYGIGWGTSRRRSGHQVVSHSGGMGGVATVLMLVPSEKIVIVGLANSRTGLPFQTAERILAALLGEAAPTPPPNQPQGDPPAPKFPGQMIGTWSGTVYTHKGELPLTLKVLESGDIHARVGRQLWTLLNQVSFNNERLEGRMMGDIGTEDASRRPHLLRLWLKLRGDTLNGAVTALSLPANRAGNALSYWAELKKQ